MTPRAALFLALPILAFSQPGTTTWTRSEDPGSGMAAREIVIAGNDRMRDAAAILHTIAKTQKVSSDNTAQSISVEGNAREVALAEWLMGELNNAAPVPAGHGYVMAHDKDDVTVVAGDLRLGTPGQAGAARVATTADLQEIASAIRALGDLPRTAVYAPAGAIVWRGKVWQNDFALSLLRDLASPPSVNWTAPVAHRLENQASPGVRIFYFAPETPVLQLGEIVSAIRQQGRVQRVVAINAERTIVMRGTDTEAAAAERIVAAGRH